jgi:hypothetical protein
MLYPLCELIDAVIRRVYGMFLCCQRMPLSRTGRLLLAPPLSVRPTHLLQPHLLAPKTFVHAPSIVSEPLSGRSPVLCCWLGGQGTGVVLEETLLPDW